MRKGIKRFSAFLLMAVMMIMMLPAMVFATEKSEKKVAIYVQTPSDWESPCVWAWNEDGTNAFEAWPGEAMDQDAANEGWYYIWLPDWATHVIVNANKGEVQTEELVLDGKDAWITITAPDVSEISYDKQTTGDAPEYVDKFAVHAKVDESWETPCLWAWSAPDGTNAFEAWPGKEMVQDENGWYTTKAPVFVNSIIINANEGEVQTEDISIDAAEVWVTVEKDGTFDFSYTDPDKAAVEDIMVHVMAPSDWDTPNLWAWSAPDGTNVFTTWPGEPLEEGENGWLEKEIPGWVNSLIVNANEGAVQTSDVSVDMGKEVWLVVNGPEDVAVSYEEPEVDTTAAKDTTAEKAEDTTEVSELTNQTDTNNMVPVIITIIVAVAVVIIIIVVITVRKKSSK